MIQTNFPSLIQEINLLFQNVPGWSSKINYNFQNHLLPTSYFAVQMPWEMETSMLF